MFWQCANYTLDLTVPRIMAVINLTADSFSDGGEYLNAASACRRVDEAVDAGADILDLGAESSRPGAYSVPEDIEWSRLQPVLKYAVKKGVPVSVDTCKPKVMQYAIDQGAAIINDIMALTQSGALAAVSSSQVGLCLMHMQGNPQSMQKAPQYGDVVNDVRTFLKDRLQHCMNEGVSGARIVLDPGIGFGKSLTHNLQILRGLEVLVALGYPLLVGVSRKSMVGMLTEQAEPKDRLAGSLAAALYAVTQGAQILRVHDVRATRDALAVWQALSKESVSIPLYQGKV